MENKQWLEQWLAKKAYTKEDILHIIGRRPLIESVSYYTKEDILHILGPQPTS